MAVDHVARAHPPLGLVGGLQWLAYHLFSFELLLVMFVFGAHLKLVIPSPPLLPETVFYGIASIAVGLWIILRQGIYRRGIPIVLAGLSFSGWMFISYGWSPSSVIARESLVYVLGINLWAVFAAACIVAGSRERTLRLLLLIVLAALILSIYGAYIEIVHGNFRFYRGPNGDWPIRTYLAWGNIVGPGATAILAIVVYTRIGSLKQLVALAAFGLCMYFLLYCGPRGPLLGILLAMIALFVINMPQIRNGRIEIPYAELLGVLIILFITAYVSFSFYTGQASATLYRFISLWEQGKDPLLRTGANRFDYYSGALTAWRSSPIIGHGLGGFAIFFCRKEDIGCNPHNVLLHALAEFGLVGFLLYLTFVWVAIRRCTFDRLRHDPLLTTLVMSFMSIVIFALVGANLPTDHRIFFFLGLLAMRAPQANTQEEEDVDSPIPDD